MGPRFGLGLHEHGVFSYVVRPDCAMKNEWNYMFDANAATVFIPEALIVVCEMDHAGTCEEIWLAALR